MPPPGGGDAAATPAAPQAAIQAAGRAAQARLQLVIAQKLLKQALVALESGTEEEKAALGALKALSPIEVDVAQGLMASEAQSMSGAAKGVPAAGGGGMSMGGPSPVPVGGQSGSYGPG